MKIEVRIEKREIKGHQAVRFDVRDGNKKIGTFGVGKRGIRWYPGRHIKNHYAKSWREVATWLEGHGRRGTEVG